MNMTLLKQGIDVKLGKGHRILMLYRKVRGGEGKGPGLCQCGRHGSYSEYNFTILTLNKLL